MKIPKYISPDRIKNAFVEVRYTTKIPFEIAVGLFYQSLDESYFYTSRPLGGKQVDLPINSPQNLKILVNQPLFYNDKIKIEFQPNSIIFNCLNEYISWKKYKPEIIKALTQLTKAKVIERYTRIGLRYISEYPNIDLRNCVKFSFTFGMPEINSETYSFRSEFKVNDLKVILNLNNHLPIANSKGATNEITITPTSSIDIDVIMDNMDVKDLKIILTNIDMIHDKEKEIFFTLLKEQFIETLNPIY